MRSECRSVIFPSEKRENVSFSLHEKFFTKYDFVGAVGI